ncbi:MAG: MMPL family transporter [Verrucomicrobiota bacterium]
MKWSRYWLWLLLIPIVGIGLSRLRLGTDVLDLLPPTEIPVQGLKLYQQHFANARELMVTVKAPTAEQAEAVARTVALRLRAATNLAASVMWQPPWMEHPEEMAEILAFMRLNQEPAAFAELTNRLAPGNLKAVLANSREVLATSFSPMDIARRAFDPYDLIHLPGTNGFGGASFENSQAMFASAEGTFRVLYVQASQDLTSYQACEPWLAAVRELVGNLRASQSDWQGVTIRFTGRPAFVTEIAGSMQRDMSGSVIGTALLIGILFWLAHRRLMPMLWLLVLLALILVSTLAVGSLVLGSISVVSMGFAAILLGLAVDYAVVHYQEALAHPHATIPEIRRAIAPSIIWAAVTTISAFLVLNFGGLPGLAQLGSLVAIGVALAALVMVFAYLPPLFPHRLKPPSEPAGAPRRNPFATAEVPSDSALPDYSRRVLAITAVLLVTCAIVVVVKHPVLDKSADPLRPMESEAEAALEEMQAALGVPKDPLWIIVAGADERDVAQRLQKTETFLNEAQARQDIGGYLLPSMLWPRPDCQASNQAAARVLASRGPLFTATALQEGFSTNALFLTAEMLRTFTRLDGATGVLWPTNATSQWLLKRFVAHPTNEWLVLGLVYPATNQVAGAARLDLLSRLPDQKVWLSGWQLLGAATLNKVRQNLWQLVLPMVLLVLASLLFAFRRLTEVLLGIAVILLSGLCLLATMGLAGWSWNLLNLMALPLILGTGVDYCIFMQLALRRYHGSLIQARRSVGRALMLCGATAVAGFGSLAWSGNAGMASLGKVCAVGIGANMLISVFLLPTWWAKLTGKK